MLLRHEVCRVAHGHGLFFDARFRHNWDLTHVERKPISPCCAPSHDEVKRVVPLAPIESVNHSSLLAQKKKKKRKPRGQHSRNGTGEGGLQISTRNRQHYARLRPSPRLGSRVLEELLALITARIQKSWHLIGPQGIWRPFIGPARFRASSEPHRAR